MAARVRQPEQHHRAYQLHRVASQDQPLAVISVRRVPRRQHKQHPRQKQRQPRRPQQQRTVRNLVNLPRYRNRLRLGPQDHKKSRQLVVAKAARLERRSAFCRSVPPRFSPSGRSHALYHGDTAGDPRRGAIERLLHAPAAFKLFTHHPPGELPHMIATKGYAAQKRHHASRPLQLRTPRARPQRHPARHRVLRHLPLRHPPGPQRVGKLPLSHGPRPRDRRHRHRHRRRKVTKFKVGDTAAIGCMVDSCRECASCKEGDEQYCDRQQTVFTYNSKDKAGNLTFGGYGNHIVLDQAYALQCAGRTWTKPQPHPCSAPASPPMRRSSTGRSAPAARSASSVSAAWATWASSSPMPLVPTPFSSPPAPARSTMPRSLVPTR